MSGTAHARFALGERTYRLCMHLLPGQLRREFGEEMVDFLQMRVAEASGRWARGRVWSEAIVDLLREATKARVGLGRSHRVWPALTAPCG